MAKITQEELQSEVLKARYKGASVAVSLHGHDAEKSAKFVVKFAHRTDRILTTRQDTQTKLASAMKAQLTNK